MIEFARQLTEVTCLDKVFFVSTGAEANEGAIKLARKWGSLKRAGAYEIVVFEDAFHGRTLATMSASGKPKWKDLYEPKVPGFIRVAKDDLSAVARAIGPRTAAVMLEPIQGEAGVIPFSAAFLGGLRELAGLDGDGRAALELPVAQLLDLAPLHRDRGGDQRLSGAARHPALDHHQRLQGGGV